MKIFIWKRTNNRNEEHNIEVIMEGETRESNEETRDVKNERHVDRE
jgi:hypothetical protein